MSKIAIVSDKTALFNTIQSKLILLRNDDVVIKCDFENAIKSTFDADVILLHFSELTEASLDIIASLKKKFNEIVLILENYNPKILLKAYDIGVFDFCTIDVTNFELLIKIINAKKVLKKEIKIENYQKILRLKGLMKRYSQVYTNLFDIINENNISDLQNMTVLALSISSDKLEYIDIDEFEKKLVLRESDIVINYEQFKYLILLPQTSVQDGVVVFNKISDNSDIDIKGVVFEYTCESSNELKNKVKRLETELDNLSENLLVWNFKENDEQQDEWLSSENLVENKNYKIFQNIYNKKIETVIEPVFYRIKQQYDYHLKNTKIKYYTDKDCCEFIVVSFEKSNSLKIEFKNCAKLCIKFIYSGLDSPENETYSVAFSEFTTRYLSDLLERFINKGEV